MHTIPEPAPWVKHGDFVVIIQGDGASATLLRGWEALCRYFAGCHYHTSDPERWAECMARLTDWEEWNNAADGFPYWLYCSYEDGSVAVIRLTNASPEDEKRDTYDDAIRPVAQP